MSVLKNRHFRHRVVQGWYEEENHHMWRANVDQFRCRFRGIAWVSDAFLRHPPIATTSVAAYKGAGDPLNARPFSILLVASARNLGVHSLEEPLGQHARCADANRN